MMHTITATLINLYHVCHRELWLHAHGIRMEHTSEIVYEGKLIGETTYQGRPTQNSQLELSVELSDSVMGTAKIDFYDVKTSIVHETKKSNKMEQAHLAQVKFYLFLLFKSGVEGAEGIIEYPKLRKRTHVTLLCTDIIEIESWIHNICEILEHEHCPPVINKAVCKCCSYQNFCYTDESL